MGSRLSQYRRYSGQHYYILRCPTPRTSCHRLRLRVLPPCSPSDWGRDEDPRRLGGEHSPRVGGSHKTTVSSHRDHSVLAASAATADPQGNGTGNVSVFGTILGSTVITRPCVIPRRLLDDSNPACSCARTYFQRPGNHGNPAD